MAAESCRVGIVQSELSGWRGWVSSRRGSGKGKNCMWDSRWEGFWASRAECSTTEDANTVQDKEFPQNEKASCLAPTGVLGESKTVFLKLNVHANHLGRRLWFNRYWVGPETLHFQSAPKLMTTLWAPKPKAKTKKDGKDHAWRRGSWRRNTSMNELWGQTKFPFLLVGWPESCEARSHGRHWHIHFRKSCFEMLLGARFLSSVTGWATCTGSETRQSWVQILALQLSSCVVLDLLMNLSEAQFSHFQKC